MAGNSVIGALRVDLGLNSAQFTNGLKTAETSLSRFGNVAARGFAVLSAAATAAAVALGYAVKKSIDHADALSKAAQKAGLTTEAFSRLAYAASFSDVSMEEMQGSLSKLSKVMADVAMGAKGPSAAAFAALGISVKDSSGNLRDSGEVFSEIAGKFARLEDGGTKTALAMALFGKSGANLIPLLNEGADGLKRFADESDRTGNTLSTETGKAAERFNDTLGGIGLSLQGVVNQIMVSALPALQGFADVLASPEFAKAAKILATNVVTAITTIIHAFETAILWADKFKTALNPSADEIKKRWAAGDGKGVLPLPLSSDAALLPGRGTRVSDSIEDHTTSTMLAGSVDAAFAALGDPKMFDSVAALKDALTPLTIKFDDLGDHATKAKEAIDPFASRMSELSDVLTETVDPFSQMKIDLTDLKTMFDAGRISATQFGDAMVKSVAGGIASAADLAGGLTGALSQMFKNNKAIAVANAIVNGIGSVAKTFETYGATPWGFAAAGIAGLTAAANVASILSTNENSTSMPGGTAGGGAPVAPAQQQQRVVNVRLEGSVFSADSVATLLADLIGDGGGSSLVKVIKAA